MSLVINHNLMAANAARSLGAHFSNLESSTRRLSSGLRITRASDDAAGLAVRELMRADIAALNQGIRNANDAVSLIQTADGALAVIDEKLIRMKELASQAATGTYSSDQRMIIDSEYQAMASEITRIANSTDFNGIYLLNGNLSGAHDGSGLTSAGKLKVHFGTGNDCAEDYYYIQINSCTASSLGLSGGVSFAQAEAAYVAKRGWTPAGGTNNWDNYSINVGVSASDTYSVLDPDGVYTRYEGGNAGIGLGNDGNLYALDGVTLIKIADAGGSSSISTQQLAQEALVTLKNAIVSKDRIRAHLGALQNRLQNTVSVLGTQAENMQAAESRISDVDVSQEMTEFVRNQILTQAAVAMLSQANSLPRMALQLISG